MGVHDSMGVHGWTATRTVATISLVLQIPAGNHEFAGSQPICLLSHLKSTCQVPAGLQRNEWGLAVPTWYLDLPLSQVSSLSRQQFFPTGPASLFLFPFFQHRSAHLLRRHLVPCTETLALASCLSRSSSPFTLSFVQILVNFSHLCLGRSQTPASTATDVLFALIVSPSRFDSF